MTMPYRKILGVTLAFVTLTTGCELIAGLTEDRHARPDPNLPDSSTFDDAGNGGNGGNGGVGGSGAPGSGGRSGIDAASGGGSSGGGTQDGSISDSGASDPDGGGACPTAGAGRCTGLLHETCSETGKWSSGLSCPYVCDEEKGCSGECVPAGNPQCKADGVTPQQCDETGTWKDGEACATGCDTTSGVCYTCVPKAKDCSGKQPRVCLDDGKQWVANGAPCSGLCANGACSSCAAGDPARCNGNVVETCDATGNWKTSVTCGASTPACHAGACAVCQPAGTQCVGTTPQTCNAGGTAWVSGAVKKGTCSAVCDPTTTQCVGSLYQTCDAAGKWSAGAVTVNKCGAICVPNAKQCSGAVQQTCNTTGTAWVNGSVTAGTCGAACTPGNTSDCAQAYGARGKCASGTVACNTSGQWSACPVTASSELCNKDNVDEDCNGDAYNGCACQNGDSIACGPCSNGTAVCNGGSYGACQGGSSPQTYYLDGDRDGWCNPNVSTAACSKPDGWVTCSCSVNCDCFDGNGYVNNANCGDYEIWGPSYGKACCGGAEDRAFDFDCGPGWHSIDCHTQRLSGGSNGFWITGFDNGVQVGQCVVHYSLQGVEGVTGRGIITCRPDGL
jgi:hypothetical protein